MKTLSKHGFKLPYIGKDKFAQLMRVGVGYDRKRRVFYLHDRSNPEVVKEILNEIFNEEVKFKSEELVETQTCYLCGTPISCRGCEHYKYCPTRESSFEETGLYCLCTACANKRDCYLQYIQKIIPLE